MYLHPEGLIVDKPTLSGGTPQLVWRYDLTDYGRQRYDAVEAHIAEDWRYGATYAATLIGAVIGTALVLVAAYTGDLMRLWDNIEWFIWPWLIGIAAAWLHAHTRARAPAPYPLIYTLRLRPDVSPSPGDPPAFRLTLECNRAEAPVEHAQPSDDLGPFDRLVSFEVQPPQEGLYPRYQLLANFTYDAAHPKQTVQLATWQQGSLETLAPQTPLHDLRTQLSWAFIDTREDWLDPLLRPAPVITSRS